MLERISLQNCVALNLVLILLLGCILDVSAWRRRGQLRPLAHSTCPSEDPTTHECFRMTTENTTCLETSIQGCVPFLEGQCEWHFTSRKVPCTVYKCEHEGCCEGWTENQHGICVSDYDEIELRCLNGGWRIERTNRCHCPEHFTGHRCETPLCDEPCLHGGRCYVVNGERRCVCPSRFYTQPMCEQVVCKEDCENGGECIPDGVLSRCKCQPGYQGDSCQYEVNIHCPIFPLNNATEMCESSDYSDNACQKSQDCSANQICCYNGCLGECVHPTNRTCLYSNVHYRAGETFSPESCKRCVCQPWGEVQCTDVECPVTDCEDGHSPITVEGHCCKICPGAAISETEGPEFENCPDRFITINLNKDGESAMLPEQQLDLKVKSHEGTSLNVYYSRREFVHSKSSNVKKNMHFVTAYSDCDSNGKRAECNFVVIVRDPYSPVFTSCPVEIFALDDEEIDWSDPVAKDNVGIFRIQADGDEIRAKKLQAGTYSVSYTVWDYDQNQAICAFAVHVFQGDIDMSDLPKEISKREVHRRIVSLSAIVAVVFGLSILVIMGVYFASCIIRKRSNRPGVGNQAGTAENHIYAVCGHERHAYENFGKLPAYSPPTNPPPYEEIDHSFDTPPIYEEIPNHRPAEEHSYENVESGCTSPSFQTEEMKYMKI